MYDNFPAAYFAPTPFWKLTIFKIKNKKKQNKDKGCCGGVPTSGVSSHWLIEATTAARLVFLSSSYSS